MTSSSPASSAAIDATALELFAGPGEMRALCRAFDWASTPLGPVSGWSTSLRLIVRTMLASRNPMFLWWGPELVQLYNDAYRPSLGGDGRHPRALGARGKTFWTDIWTTIGPQIEQVMTTGEPTWHEDQYLPIERNGRLEDVWWTYSYSPVHEDDGSIAGTLVVCLETTRRVRYEQEREGLLRELDLERSRLVAVFQQSPSFLAMLRGPDHVVEFANEAYYQLVGHRDIVGKPVRDALPEVVAQGFLEILDRVLQTGEPFIGRDVAVRLQRSPDGPLEERFADFIYQALSDADGTRSGVVAHGFDVTEQTLARRESLRIVTESERVRLDAERARERTAALASLTLALTSTHTEHDVIDTIVGQATQVFGAVGTVIARIASDGRALELVRATDMPEEIEREWHRFPLDAPTPLAEAVRTGEPVFLESRAAWHERYPAMTPALEATGHHANMVLPLAVDGRSFGALGIAFDEPRAFDAEDRALALTVARQCAQALERVHLFEAEHAARRDAEAANRAKSEFLATMSHELRTPLNAIGGYAEMLELGIRGPITEAQRTDLNRIKASQRHLLGLVDEVLDLARVDSGELQVERAAVPVGDTVDAALALVRPQAASKGIRLAERCDGPAHRAYLGDEPRVRQVLVNLLGNAVKFTPAGGRIDVSCTVVSRLPNGGGTGTPYVGLQVRDTGVGIDPDQVARIFEPFTQAEGGLTRVRGGTGLGLAISRRLARLMGGEVTVTSEPGKGSTFTLWLATPELRAAPRGSSVDAETDAAMGSATHNPVESELESTMSHRREDVQDSHEAAVAMVAIGDRLLPHAEPMASMWARRLREDERVPTGAHTDGELENHTVTFMTEIALALRTIGQRDQDASAQLRDGTAILALLAERHGSQRARLEWTDDAIRREYELMQEILEPRVRAVAAEGGEPTLAVADRAVEVVQQLLAQARRLTLSGYRLAVVTRDSDDSA